jgi:hypothetical protein
MINDDRITIIVTPINIAIKRPGPDDFTASSRKDRDAGIIRKIKPMMNPIRQSVGGRWLNTVWVPFQVEVATIGW